MGCSEEEQVETASLLKKSSNPSKDYKCSLMKNLKMITEAVPHYLLKSEITLM